MPQIIIRSRVYIATPYRTETMRDSYDRYLLKCIEDSILKGEAPYAPHVYLPKLKLCDDRTTEGRRIGMEVGQKFLNICQLLAVYKDFGISEGMQMEMDTAKNLKIPINIRSIL